VAQNRLVDHDVKPGVESHIGDGDAWPAIREQMLGSEKDWTHQTGDVAAHLLAVARALRAHPIPKPPNA
jgi:hypothetical protein